MNERRESAEDRSQRPRAPEALPAGGLEREEYIEQAYLFRTLAERQRAGQTVQESLEAVRQEILVTTKLPMAIDFMLSELRHSGGFSQAMARLRHYFSAFQAFLVRQAEDDRGRFDLRVAFAILRKEAEYRANQPTPQGVFMFQFESLCRNRLSYDGGLGAMAEDPVYHEGWRNWILIVRRQVGLVDLADLIYVRSKYYGLAPGATRHAGEPDIQALFGEKEGRIAWANRRKDPLLLFAALQRQLGYPEVPRAEPFDDRIDLVPQLLRRMERLEQRMKLMEEEQRGGIDLTKFYSARQPFEGLGPS